MDLWAMQLNWLYSRFPNPTRFNNTADKYLEEYIMGFFKVVHGSYMA